MRIGKTLTAMTCCAVFFFASTRLALAIPDYQVGIVSTMDKIFKKTSLNPLFGTQNIFTIGKNNGSCSEFDGGLAQNPFTAGGADVDMPSYVTVGSDQRIDFTPDANSAGKNCLLQYDLIRGYYSDLSRGGDSWLPWSLDISVNGARVSTSSCILGPAILEIPSSFLRTGVNEILFDFKADIDGRDVAFDYIQLSIPAVSLPSPNAVINMGRNEYEAVQAAVIANKDLSQVTLEMSDLVQPAGAMIAHENVSLKLVGYVPETTTSPYLWPDPLPDYTAFNVNAGETQPIWLTVYCPPGTPKGRYEGKLTIRPSNAAAMDVPVTVNVLDFTLPVDTYLQFTFSIWNNSLAVFHGADQRSPAFAAIRQAYVDDFVRHRISPTEPDYYPTQMKFVLKPDGSSSVDHIDYTQFDTDVSSLENEGLSCFAYNTYDSRSQADNWFTGGPTLFDPVSGQYVWRTLPTPYSDEWRQREIAIFRDQAAHFRQNGWLNDAYYYVVGEPNKLAHDWCSTMDDYQYAAWMGSMLHEADPGIRRVAAMYNTYDDNPFPAEFGDQIDIWCVSTDVLAKHLADADVERAKGKILWTYTPGYFNYNCVSSVSRRVGPWICWKYDLRGWLHTDTTVWDDNPWTGAASYRDTLLYPGQNGPVDSMGWENLRDGMEDYEYFRLLKSTIDSAKTLPNLSQAQLNLIAESEALLVINPAIIETPTKWSDNNSDFLALRDQIGAHIAELNDLYAAPGPVTGFVATTGNSQVSLSWSNPTSSDFQGTMIRYKTTGYPTGPTDGSLACDRLAASGSTDIYTHSGLSYAVYYYSAFAHDSAFNYSSPSNLSAIPGCAAVWLDESFDSFTDGALGGQGQWQTTGTAGDDAQSIVAKSGKALACDPIAAGASVENTIAFEARSGGYHYVTLDFAENASGATGQEIGYVSFQSLDSAEAARLHIQKGRLMLEYGNGSLALLSTSASNLSWYNLRLGFNVDARTLDIWLDGASKSAGCAWKSGTNLGKIVVGAVRNTSLSVQRFYLDNLLGENKPGQTTQVRDDGSWTPSLSKLHFSFDPVGCAGEYRYAIGYTSGGTQTRTWTSCGLMTDVMAAGLSLADGKTYYVSVQAGTGRGTWGTTKTSDGITVAPAVGIQEAKGLADGSPSEVRSIRGKTVSAKFPGCFYIEDTVSRFGVKVMSSAPVSVGDQVDICGVIKGSGAERYLDGIGNPAISTAGIGVPAPASINGRILGGPALNTRTPGVNAGTGVNNIGMFIAFTGMVTSTGPGFFYIDDGSGQMDNRTDPATGKPFAGVKIIDTADTVGQGEFWTVRGISTLDSNGSGFARAIAATSGARLR